MLAVKSANVRDNFKEWCDKISMGENVVIARSQNENIYMISEAEYNTLQKAKRNAEYLAMLNKSEDLGEKLTYIAEMQKNPKARQVISYIKAPEQAMCPVQGMNLM